MPYRVGSRRAGIGAYKAEEAGFAVVRCSAAEERPICPARVEDDAEIIELHRVERM